MRIGFYQHNTTLAAGGLTPYGLRVLSALCEDEGLRAKNVEIVVVSAEESVDFAGECVSCPNPASLGSVAEASRLDLLHFPTQVPPTFDFDRPFSITMHDVQELHFPHFFTAEERRERAVRYLWSLRGAQRVAVSFEHVKRDLIRYFQVPEEKIDVLPLPCHKVVLEGESAIADADSQLEFLAREPTAFLLYPAHTWEHKNHLRLIQAFEAVRRNLGEDVWLICTGNHYAPYFPSIEKRLSASPLRDRILFPGIVEVSTLRWLYENARAVVVPSLYEAGSFPLLEAMGLGAPVICAATTSLPDTIAERELVFDPLDPVAMAASMERIVSDTEFREMAVQHCRRRFRELESEARISTGRVYHDFWRRAIEEPMASDSDDPGLTGWLDRDASRARKCMESIDYRVGRILLDPVRHLARRFRGR